LGLRARTGAIVAPVGPTAGAGPGPKIGPKWRDDDACQTSRGPHSRPPWWGPLTASYGPPRGQCAGHAWAGPARAQP